MGLEDDAVVVDSDSDSDVDMDDDTVMVGAASSARVQPTDVGFSDFDDFGGFQAKAAHPTPDRESLAVGWGSLTSPYHEVRGAHLVTRAFRKGRKCTDQRLGPAAQKGVTPGTPAPELRLGIYE